MTDKQITLRIILRILRTLFQGFRLITGGLKEEIAALEQELRDAPTDKTEVDTYKQQF